MKDIDLLELKNHHETVGLIFSQSALWNFDRGHPVV